MKKSTKGALAAAAAAVLLLGGAGTLAYWTAEDAVDAGTLAAGELKLTAESCDAAWAHADETPVTLIVPGDTIHKTCTFTILAKGDNLVATPTTPESVPYTVTSSDVNPPPTLNLTATASYAATSGLTAGGKVTEANDGDSFTATIEVAYPYGDETMINANDTQNLVAALDELTVSLVQDDPNAV